MIDEHWVPRPTLLRDLDRAMTRGRALLLAPAGSGKSVAARQWMARCAAPTVIVSLDSGVRTAGEIAKLLADATATVGGGDGGVIMLDAVDALAPPELEGALWQLVARLPAHVRVLLTSRAAAPEPFASLGDSTLGASSLRFSGKSAAALIGRACDRRLTDAHVDALVDRTDGWAVGLRLAGLALRDAADVDAFVERFGGDDVFVAAYLSDEVLARESQEARELLLATSVLDRLDDDRCAAVTASAGAPQLLRDLRRRSVFVDSNGDGDAHYAAMFQQYLHHELRTSAPDLEVAARRRAADWHIERGEPIEATDQLIAAGAWDRVIDHVRSYGQELFHQGRAEVALRWIDAVPSAVRAERRVALDKAALHSMVGNTIAAQETIDEAEQDGGLTSGERVVVDGLRVTWVQWHSSCATVIAAADGLLAALDQVPANDIPDVLGVTSVESLRVVAIASRARAHWHRGEIVAARDELRRLLAAGVAYPPWAVDALGAAGLLEAWAGELSTAQRYAERALDLAAGSGLDRHPSRIDALAATACVHRERGAFDRAAEALEDAHATAAQTGRSVSLCVVTIEEALLDLARAAPARGLERFAELRASGHADPPPLIDDRLRSVEVRLRLACGDVSGAGRVTLDLTSGSAELLCAAVEVSVAARDLAAATRHLEAWSTGGELRSAIERVMWTAVVADLDGRRDDAASSLGIALELARPDGHVHVFDRGPDVQRLVRAMPRKTVSPYLDPVRGGQRAAGAPTEADGTMPNLSERELMVLGYLPSRLSNAEIARHLYVSRNTVKTHLRRIYRALEVDGRRAAVEKASELGLI